MNYIVTWTTDVPPHSVASSYGCVLCGNKLAAESVVRKLIQEGYKSSSIVIYASAHIVPFSVNERVVKHVDVAVGDPDA